MAMADKRLNQVSVKKYRGGLLSKCRPSKGMEKIKRAAPPSIMEEELITSRDATLQAVDDRLWGVIAAPEDTLTDLAYPAIRLEDAPDDYDRAEGFLFLSTSDWTDRRQALLQASLARLSRTVLIGNAEDLAGSQIFRVQFSGVREVFARRAQKNLESEARDLHDLNDVGNWARGQIRAVAGDLECEGLAPVVGGEPIAHQITPAGVILCTG